MSLPENGLAVNRVQLWQNAQTGEEILAAVVASRAPSFVTATAGRTCMTRWLALQAQAPGPLLEEFDIDRSGISIFYEAVTDDGPPELRFALVFKPRPAFVYAATHCATMTIVFTDGQSPDWACWPDDARTLFAEYGITIPESPQDVLG